MSPFGLLTMFAASAGLGYLLAISRGRLHPGDLMRKLAQTWSHQPLRPLRIEFSNGLTAAFVCLFMSLLFSSMISSAGGPLPGLLATMCGVAYWVLLPLWVVRDARSRGGRAWAWGLMTLFTNILGLFSYLVARPEALKECHRCGFMLREDYSVCPYCGPDSRRSCSACQGTLEPDWRYCPYCQATVSSVDPERLAVSG